jgi:hypothetical protein
MSTRTLLRVAALPFVLAGAALMAHAQTKNPSAEPAPVAKDKEVVEAAFKRADANGDGKLSKEEAAKLPAISAKFDQLDKSKQGFITLEEFAAGFAKGN